MLSQDLSRNQLRLIGTSMGNMVKRVVIAVAAIAVVLWLILTVYTLIGGPG